MDYLIYVTWKTDMSVKLWGSKISNKNWILYWHYACKLMYKIMYTAFKNRK